MRQYRRLGFAFASVILLISSTADGLAGSAGEERAALERELTALGAALGHLREKADLPGRDQLPDAELFHKGAAWALTYEPRLAGKDLDLVRRALSRGRERVTALEAGKLPWASRKGKLVRGYRSAVDGSVQPYALVVPRSYDPRRPIRLDVVLHGSTRPVGLSELRFLNPYDEGDGAETSAPDAEFIELRPLGRVENCYRWAGETDVFEAIEDVCRDYNIDRDRIVLRGMSMGASGTWHLGLKHPDRFVALGPYCGYVDTYQFSRTPLPNFVPVEPLPEPQERMLHMLDSVDYAANAGLVPAIAAMGEKDVFFQAHVIMEAAMRKEGLRMVNLISPGTGHVQDPVTFSEQMRQIGRYAGRGVDRKPDQVRFVTWTLKYPRAHWVELLGLEAHYRRAEIRARRMDNGDVVVEELKNITRFALHRPAVGAEVRIGERKVRIPPEARQADAVVFERSGRGWRCAGDRRAAEIRRKRPGLQGPIDDAFTRPFLCVRGTGQPWNPAVTKWADANLERFRYEWHRYFRGELPVKADTEVTPADLRGTNLVLFGDPGSNRWIRRALPHLPLRWSRKELRFDGATYRSADHAPVLIQPNPLPGGQGNYLVLNSGHTFHETELASLNYLLFPRLGDWAVLRVGGKTPASPSDPLDEEVLRSGFFNERWGL